jgi:hypothetical protein
MRSWEFSVLFVELWGMQRIGVKPALLWRWMMEEESGVMN